MQPVLTWPYGHGGPGSGSGSVRDSELQLTVLVTHILLTRHRTGVIIREDNVVGWRTVLRPQASALNEGNEGMEGARSLQRGGAGA